MLFRSHWCGYVAIPEGHPWHNLGYDEIHDQMPDLRVHGGLTYANRDADRQAWVIGFDCAHAGDAVPLSTSLGHVRSTCDIYRDQHYVRVETSLLSAYADAAEGDN